MVACFLFVGCTTYQAPRVSVASIEVKESTAEALVLSVTLDVENANNVPIELHQFHYALTASGAQAFSGRWAAQATVGPGLTSSLTVPAVIRREQVPASGSMADYRLSGRMTYTAPGYWAQAMLDLGLPRPAVSFADQGSLDSR